ncbi:MAG: hypothetical protein R3B72_14540 [Polyangiaceae bacterium]
MRARFLAQLVALVAALAVQLPAAHADPEQDLARAESRFLTGGYEEAAGILGPLLDKRVDPTAPDAAARLDVQRRARPLYAACLIALERTGEADAVILEHYRDDPFYEPPPGRFPQLVVDRFLQVAARNRAQIDAWKEAVVSKQQSDAAARAELERLRAERLAILERMASEGVTFRSRWVAMVPFGVGQFQNGDIGLGAFFAVGTTLGVAGTIASFSVAQVASDQSVNCRKNNAASDTGVIVACGVLEQRYRTASIVNWVSLGTTAALVVGGIIQAQVAFVEETVEPNKRRIPPRPVYVSPTAAISPQGAFFGLEGRF